MTNNQPESIEEKAATYAEGPWTCIIRSNYRMHYDGFIAGAADRDEHYREVVSALENTSGALETLLTEFNLDLIPSVRLAFMGMVLKSRAALQNVKK
jgi:hypothetical protein